jgi:hypothetical protein
MGKRKAHELDAASLPSMYVPLPLETPETVYARDAILIGLLKGE